MVASDVSASVENAGGLIGYAEDIKLNLCNYTTSPTSEVSAPKCAGGLVGYMEEGDLSKGNHACFEGCYNWGDIDVAVDDDHGLGGLAGYMDSYAELWWNINFKEPSGHNSSDNTGHIWGKKKGEYTTKHNYYVYDTAAMANADNFADLKINATDSYWVMSAGDPHPRIKDCPFQNATYIPDSK